jgi:hypothetical protein
VPLASSVLPNLDEPDTDLTRDQRTEDEAARWHGDDDRDRIPAVQTHQGIDQLGS